MTVIQLTDNDLLLYKFTSPPIFVSQIYVDPSRIFEFEFGTYEDDLDEFISAYFLVDDVYVLISRYNGELNNMLSIYVDKDKALQKNLYLDDIVNNLLNYLKL